MDRLTGRFRWRAAELCLHGSLITSRGTSSSFPLANHSHLLASQSVFGISQDPPMCVHASVLAKVDPIDQASR